MNVGLLGAGRIGSLHADTLGRDPRVDHVLVSDPIAQRAADVSDRVGGTVVEEPAELLSTCDAVVIASSTDLHERHLVMAAEAGVPAFCEKPIALDLASTDRAIAAVEASGTPVQMGFNRRFDPEFAAAREAVRAGALGQVLLVIGQHHDHQPPPVEYVGPSGGQFADQLIHDFDLLRFVTGQEVVAVNAAGSDAGMDMFGRHGDTAVSVVTLWLDGGTMATLCGVRMDPLGYDVRMEVFGTEDSIAVGLDDQTPIRPVNAPAPTSPHREWLPRFGASYAAEMDAFLQVVQGTAESPCTVADARAALMIATACRLSLQEGHPVDLKDVS
ncbi:Gfo/Idh/MocA family oxidoreductase [Euzebya tangerina]|uniref:Gfo/Idh/MocA family oxidoreductase n=1 Tax=Euzebya tangerina TaxID=591198 RepID=UPI000E30EFB4|nr:Gfo/Idh/MocA family oxidoreductase [Euzebya tangerina]